MRKVSIRDKLELVDEYWSPKVVGQVNDTQVKVAKLKGEFPWHAHEAEDELFLVAKGELRLEFREGAVVLSEGEFLIVPRGVEHRPVAEAEVHVVLVEPATTVNTGNVRNERTMEAPDWI